jgi:hypothetical protein
MKNILALMVSLWLTGSLFAHDISLAWNPAGPEYTGYKIYYCQLGQTLTNVWRVGLTNMTTISGLVSSPSVSYRFSIVATNAQYETPPTLELVTEIPPHAVKNPRFVGRTANGFTVTWAPSDETDIASYKVTYGSVSNWTVNVLSVPATTTLVTLTNLVSFTEYYFDITAVNAPGVESWPKFQLRDTLLPPGPSDIKVAIQVK